MVLPISTQARQTELLRKARTQTILVTVDALSQRKIIYIARESITVRLTSCFARLVSAVLL